jgi:hypothetical protein
MWIVAAVAMVLAGALMVAGSAVLRRQPAGTASISSSCPR